MSKQASTTPEGSGSGSGTRRTRGSSDGRRPTVRAFTYRPNPEAAAALEFLVGEIGSPGRGGLGLSTQEIVHQALSLYGRMVHETRGNGDRLVLENPRTGHRRDVMWPGLMQPLPAPAHGDRLEADVEPPGGPAATEPEPAMARNGASSH